jgi:hypothetical protein
MSRENVEIVRKNYEVLNSIGRTGPEFVGPEEVAHDGKAAVAPPKAKALGRPLRVRDKRGTTNVPRRRS